jgi:hypothetical protein
MGGMDNGERSEVAVFAAARGNQLALVLRRMVIHHAPIVVRSVIENVVRFDRRGQSREDLPPRPSILGMSGRISAAVGAPGHIDESQPGLGNFGQTLGGSNL